MCTQSESVVPNSMQTLVCSRFWPAEMLQRNLLTYYPPCLCGTQGNNKIFPTLSIFSQFFDGALAVIEPPQSLLYCPVPSCFWVLSTSFAFRCPVHCNFGYVVTGLRHHMTDPPPSSPVDKCTNILLLGLPQQLVV